VVRSRGKKKENDQRGGNVVQKSSSPTRLPHASRVILTIDLPSVIWRTQTTISVSQAQVTAQTTMHTHISHLISPTHTHTHTYPDKGATTFDPMVRPFSFFFFHAVPRLCVFVYNMCAVFGAWSCTQHNETVHNRTNGFNMPVPPNPPFCHLSILLEWGIYLERHTGLVHDIGQKNKTKQSVLKGRGEKRSGDEGGPLLFHSSGTQATSAG